MPKNFIIISLLAKFRDEGRFENRRYP